MTVSTFGPISKGSNLNISQEYGNNGTLTATMLDGLHDTATLNYSYLGRELITSSNDDANRLKLEATMVVCAVMCCFVIH